MLHSVSVVPAGRSHSVRLQRLPERLSDYPMACCLRNSHLKPDSQLQLHPYHGFFLLRMSFAYFVSCPLIRQIELVSMQLNATRFRNTDKSQTTKGKRCQNIWRYTTGSPGCCYHFSLAVAECPTMPLKPTETTSNLALTLSFSTKNETSRHSCDERRSYSANGVTELHQLRPKC